MREEIATDLLQDLHVLFLETTRSNNNVQLEPFLAFLKRAVAIAQRALEARVQRTLVPESATEERADALDVAVEIPALLVSVFADYTIRADHTILHSRATC